MIQFINIDIYMKSISEKEKKLEETLEKLKNLEIPNSNKIIELEKLENQKNQLEIEKKQIEARCDTLEKENEILKLQFDEFKKREIEEKKKGRAIF